MLICKPRFCLPLRPMHYIKGVPITRSSHGFYHVIPSGKLGCRLQLKVELFNYYINEKIETSSHGF